MVWVKGGEDMDKNTQKVIHIVSFSLVVVGALNWGLIAINPTWDLVAMLSGGMTTTIAAITVSAVGYFLSAPEELKQIFLIITIASLLDIITTYVGNAGILIRYCKKKNIT